MGLDSGTKLGPYEVQAPLGAGGMGEVYRARDTRLDRAVAIKILPSHLSADPEFKQRFEREARAVSSLNHPNICQLFDVGRQDGTDFLVMEFLDGETLAERVRRGALPLPELLKVGMTVAQALAAAHRAGMVHRDLKPANIMLTKGGAKLMDFGLAKPAAAAAGGSGSAPLLSAARTMSGPTPVSPLTTAGSIVGTIQYMSPEQIEGKEIDARADIFALGAVLYEMATGKRAFEGKSQISVASAILEKDPEPVHTSKPEIPPALDSLIAGCLAKDREERFQSAHDVWMRLKEITDRPQAASAPSRGGLATGVLLAVSAALLATAVVLFLISRSAAPGFSVRAYIPPPPGTAFRPTGFDSGPVVVSPDGKMLAFSAVDEKGITNLWIRPLDAAQATMLPGTEDASAPFWSPDGQHLAFIADRKLKKISVRGESAQTLADEAAYGGSWSADGIILFSAKNNGPLSAVAATGGQASDATKLAAGELFHSEPSFLPDGKYFLYRAYGRDTPSVIKVGELGNPNGKPVDVVQGEAPNFASGRLIFVRDGHILAQSFNLKTMKVSGDPQALGEASKLSVSPAGVLAYHESSNRSELKVFDRSGNVIAVPGALAAYSAPRFSPDGKSIAVTVTDSRSEKSDIWVYPAAGGQPTRITFGPDDYWPVWSPDGKELGYALNDNGKISFRRRPLDGHTPEETIFETEAYSGGSTLDWSPDGKYLSIDLRDKSGTWSNWILPLEGKHEPFRPPSTANITASAYDGMFSPDGRWLAYFSYESGRPEVYVVPFQSEGLKYQASTIGGWVPRFGDKREFFFITMGNRLMVAPIEAQANFRLGATQPLFQLDLPNFAGPNYSVSPDGQHFAVLTVDHTKSSSITLLTNWTAALPK
ncbi:MAG TPA: protein kinase [Candidatus Sulfotelmatobacter sp.]|nr:protein kinase [Candidatus Sulfotelmatobacter sp.]